MDIIVINSKNSKKSDPHRILLNLTVEINLKRSDKYVALSNLIIHYAWKNINKMSASTWNEEFEWPHGSYLVSDIQDYFKYILKNMEKRLIILQREYT